MARTDEQRARAAAYAREWRARNADRLRAQRRERYRAREADQVKTDEYRTRNAARARRDWAEDRGGYREKANARSRKSKARNAAKISVARKERDRRSHLKGHGPMIADWIADAGIAQGGRCYLCGDPLRSAGGTVVDHDHSCCPTGSSCSACRRGLACQRCNRLIGMANDDPGLLRQIADALESALTAARSRIGEKSSQLSFSVDEETA